MERPLFVFGIASTGRSRLAADLIGRIASISRVFCCVPEDQVLEYARAMGGMESADNVEISSVPSDTRDISIARNLVLHRAKMLNPEYLVQIDDDVIVKDWDEVISSLLTCMESHSWLGALSSCSRFFARGPNGREDLWTSTDDFQIVPSLYQLCILRMVALDEVGGYRTRSREDVEMALRLWRAGWGVGRLLQGTHDVKRGKTKDDTPTTHGGLATHSVEERNAMNQDGVAYIKQHYSDFVRIVERPNLGAGATYMMRANWPELTDAVRERWGEGIYQDGRGRVI